MKFAVGAVVFTAVMLLAYSYPALSIAVTAAYIYLQLYDLHFGERHSDAGTGNPK